ncbi:MAG: transglutaminase domain-containing protein [Myxococcales bacterium]|nr:transglutaminase domain-containing protein [Myxococcales bacterium]
MTPSKAVTSLLFVLAGCAGTPPPPQTPAVGPAIATSPVPARSATFAAQNEVKIQVPEGAKLVRLWMAMPQEDTAQDVREFQVTAPAPHRVEGDKDGNKFVYVEFKEPKDKELLVRETFVVTRREVKSGVDASKSRPITDAERAQYAAHLGPNENVVIDDEIRKLSASIVGTEKNPVLASRKLYDWVLNNVEYWVKDPKNKKASPIGSTTYCLTNKTGNCTDFHSLWTSLARAQGIPTRMIYGSFFKAELDGQSEDQSYHCWPEFYAPGFGWVPHDVAIADIFAGDFQTTPDNEKPVRLTTGDGYRGGDRAKVDYYFGNIDERRVTWSRGRDLTLSPKQEGGPVNALPKAYVEIDGKVAAEKVAWTRKLTFKEQKSK